MEIRKPPAPLPVPGDTRIVFLAGSIEMGAAADWQTELVTALGDRDLVVLNPRRDAWDASWRQSIEEPDFRGQVEWELEGLPVAGDWPSFVAAVLRALDS